MAFVEIINANEAVQLIGDEDFIAIQGSGGGVGEPTALLYALRERYLAESQPRDITLCHATGIGDQKEIGADLLALPGLVKRDIAGHLAMAPKMAQMIVDDQVESYNFPQGVLSQMFSAVAARKPGVFSKVGLHTYIDPRVDGGRMNAITTEDMVEVVNFGGEEWLFWPSFPINVAFVRGTTADTKGNITSEEEPAILEGISIAQAAKANGGNVIAQVKYLAEAGTLDPQAVRIPGVCVDYVVVVPEQKQTCQDVYNPAYTGHVRVPLERIDPLPLGPRKVIARRAAQELFPGAIVNLGVGMPSGIASVATEVGIIDDITFVVEHGVIGGIPASGVIFGVSYNPEAIIGEDRQFDFFDGGGLDLAFLGMAQMDGHGNVNASKVDGLLAGCGGFINISQNTKRVIFCGTFTAKELQCEVGGGRIQIVREGSITKVVKDVAQITFSGRYAKQMAQPVLYITERAVFELHPSGIKLIEVAPGIDLKQDILDKMEFEPLIDVPVKTMDPAIFS